MSQGGKLRDGGARYDAGIILQAWLRSIKRLKRRRPCVSRNAF